MSGQELGKSEGRYTLSVYSLLLVHVALTSTIVLPVGLIQETLPCKYFSSNSFSSPSLFCWDADHGMMSKLLNSSRCSLQLQPKQKVNSLVMNNFSFQLVTVKPVRFLVNETCAVVPEVDQVMFPRISGGTGVVNILVGIDQLQGIPINRGEIHLVRLEKL